MYRVSRLGVLAPLLLGYATICPADPMAGDGPPRNEHYEVAPFFGFRMGGSFTSSDTGRRVDVDDHASWGLALDVRKDDATRYELFYGRQSTAIRGGSLLAPTHLNVEYLHLGGTVLLDDEPRVKPYLLGGLGVTRFSPDVAPGHASTRFSASLGAGLRVPCSEHFSLRLEARGFVTLVNPDTAFFCRSDQTGLLCRVHSHGSTLIQYDLLAGAAYAF